MRTQLRNHGLKKSAARRLLICAMTAKAAAKTSAKVSLHHGSSFPAAWENVLLPWFRIAARVSWQQQEPTLVVVPFRSHAYAIKGLLLARGVSLLGIRFVSPPE